MMRLTALVISAAISTPALADNVKRVNCDRGKSLAKAVTRARTDDTLIVSGHCKGPIVVTQDGLTIYGRSATIRAAAQRDVLTVSGASRVEISGFDIHGGLRGVVGEQGAGFALTGVGVSASAGSGIEITEQSHGALHDVAISDAAGNGLNVIKGSGVSLTGDLNITNGAAFGLNAENLSNVTSDAAELAINGNAAMGLHAVTGSNVFLNDSTLNASGNVLRGVSINSAASLFVFGTQVIANDTVALDGVAFANATVDLDADASITANGNGRNGIVVESSTLTSFIFPPVNGPRITANENKVNGISVVLGGKLEIKSGSSMEVTKNGVAGLSLNDGSAANLRDAVIVDNAGADITLEFVSRLNTVSGNTVGTVVCDDSSVSKGEFNCQ